MTSGTLPVQCHHNVVTLVTQCRYINYSMSRRCRDINCSMSRHFANVTTSSTLPIQCRNNVVTSVTQCRNDVATSAETAADGFTFFFLLFLAFCFDMGLYPKPNCTTYKRLAPPRPNIIHNKCKTIMKTVYGSSITTLLHKIRVQN